MQYPKISIVTPNYNGGQFLEETILSVIGQNYPNLEYIIIDGGSTDNSVEIIKKYEKHLAYWVSEKDKGQSDAINKGFDRSTGEIMAWLNSDDLYMPNTLKKVVDFIDINSKEIIFGNCIQFSEDLEYIAGSNVRKKYNEFHLPFDTGYLIQPSTFWTRKLWKDMGNLDITLNYTFDWLWFAKAIPQAKLKPIDIYCSMYRIHNNHKSSNGGIKRFNEIVEVLEKLGYEKYSRILQKSVPQKDRIMYIKDVIKRLKLSKWEYPIMKTIFRQYFSGLSLPEYKEMLTQIRVAL